MYKVNKCSLDRIEFNFIEKFIDDPLSYCPIWAQENNYSNSMSHATISEEIGAENTEERKNK